MVGSEFHSVRCMILPPMLPFAKFCVFRHHWWLETVGQRYPTRAVRPSHINAIMAGRVRGDHASRTSVVVVVVVGRERVQVEEDMVPDCGETSEQLR